MTAPGSATGYLPRHHGRMLTVASVNVNGIRAARRRGIQPWLAARDPAVLCLQEVRATSDVLHEQLGNDWHVAYADCETPGRAGVAVASRRPPTRVQAGLGLGSVDSGRWVEADLKVDPGATLTVASAYVHTGEAGTPHQADKFTFLRAMLDRLTELAADGRHVLLTGDLNIAHRQVDLKNWKGNIGKSGFLPEEQAILDRLLDEHGWVDVVRANSGPGPGPYSWWSWRGRAFDNDAGWRIDYQVASPGLAGFARKAEIDRAPTYAERWSDHAPVVVHYDLG